MSLYMKCRVICLHLHQVQTHVDNSKYANYSKYFQFTKSHHPHNSNGTEFPLLVLELTIGIGSSGFSLDLQSIYIPKHESQLSLGITENIPTAAIPTRVKRDKLQEQFYGGRRSMLFASLCPYNYFAADDY